MTQLLTAIGLMSGTSMDGVDAAILRTDGENAAERVASSFTPYPEDVKSAIRACLGLSRDPDGRVAEAEELVTYWHATAVRNMLRTAGEDVDIIGFHGQTVFHDPAMALTWQIGDGQRLADALGVDVVYDFRSADMRAGGQGAPLLPLYHRVLVAQAGLQQPVCILNLGGVANITWIDGDTIIACDTGPANALIDDWMLLKTGIPLDPNGAAGLKGAVDEARVKTWLDHSFFSQPAPKSLDRNAFAHCNVDDLSVHDGAATLAAFTADAVLRALHLMPESPRQLIVAGGGRFNQAVMKRLSARVPVTDADTLGWSGDSIEAEGFAYLAVRSLKGLPISLPTTTGVRQPLTGGRHARHRKA